MNDQQNENQQIPLESTKADEPRERACKYKYSKLKCVRDVDGYIPVGDVLTALSAQYAEVCSTWRSLLDTRFKLLGLLPFVTAAALLVLLPNADSSSSLSGMESLAIGFVGLVASIGLWIYDQRNDELYNDLISRGRRIEAEMGVRNGVFLGRPSPTRAFINHSWGTGLVYSASILGWLFVVLRIIYLGCICRW